MIVIETLITILFFMCNLIIGCAVFIGIMCGMYFLSLFLANRIILFFLWFFTMEGAGS